jgi:dihydrofolate reductase
MEAEMRKLMVSTLMTLDGVVQDPGGFGEIEQGGWAGPYFDDEALGLALDHLRAADVFLLGRQTYELFKQFWSRAHPGAYTDLMNSIPKLVASTTLDGRLEWNATSVKGDIAEAIAELKRQPGGDILMYGSPTLMSTLMRHDLVDKYQIWVHPVVLGGGKRLFTEGDKATLRMVETKTLGTGVVIVTYQPGR